MRSVVEEPEFPRSQPLMPKHFSPTVMADREGASGRTILTHPLLLPNGMERIHNYVVAGNGTAQEALERAVKDWA